MVDINPYHMNHIGKGLINKEEFLSHNILTHPTFVTAGLSGTYKELLQGKPFDKDEVYFPTTMRGTDAYCNVRGAPLLRDGEVIGAIIN